MAYSYPKIIEIFKYCPVPQTVTSTKRWGNSDYHDFGLATDFASIYGSMPRLQADSMMRDAAAWWYGFSSRLLELIHTTPFSTDNGYYVKNGDRVGPGFYGWATEAAHLDHCHVAMTYSSASTLLSQLKTKYGTPGKKRVYRSNGTWYYPSTTPVPKPPAFDPKQPFGPGTYHIVKAGETLSFIAKKYNTTVTAILKLNPYRTTPIPHGFTNPDKIGIGWNIRVR